MTAKEVGQFDFAASAVGQDISIAIQFWNPDRILSHALGEEKQSKPFWDWVAIYPAAGRWREISHKPVFQGRTVVRVEHDIGPQIKLALAR